MARRIAVGLIWRGDHVVVGQRAAGGELAGYAEFPGGKCQTDEEPARAVARECQEETGLIVQVRRLRWQQQHAYNFGTLELYFFDVEPALEDYPPIESASPGTANAWFPTVLPPFRWVSARDLQTLSFPPANRMLLEQLRAEFPPS